MSPDTPHPPEKPGGSKIVHSTPQIGAGPAKTTERQISLEPEPVPVVEATGPVAGQQSKITAFGRKKRHEEEWSRTPNTTGTGAIHVKTFHAKLTDDALVHVDQGVNEWLDAHPQYEVKLVSTTVGTMTGKVKEPHVVCQVWV